ncbi:hypothetical protein DENSPDRAFT_933010 [Dentipellis sp. KUC8613]|nr:hypothetical protein DENSPDRAFT_933010 [Dentipellis sp. KUC8613]
MAYASHHGDRRANANYAQGQGYNPSQNHRPRRRHRPYPSASASTSTLTSNSHYVDRAYDARAGYGYEDRVYPNGRGADAYGDGYYHAGAGAYDNSGYGYGYDEGYRADAYSDSRGYEDGYGSYGNGYADAGSQQAEYDYGYYSGQGAASYYPSQPQTQTQPYHAGPISLAPFLSSQQHTSHSDSYQQSTRPYTTASSSRRQTQPNAAYARNTPPPPQASTHLDHHPSPQTYLPPHKRVKRSPTPPPTGPAPTPSAAYLALAHTPSTTLPATTAAPRKLLILDLNGTLVLRSARAPRRTAQLRRVHARTFLPALRAFLFHAHTRAWLDVMVWSSAQPHSVADMVDKAFGASKGMLGAVWARDTLGLGGESYHKKVQTIKDLEKPWRELFQPRHAEEPGSDSDIGSSPPASPPPSSSPLPPSSQQTTADADADPPNSTTAPTRHSALTTLLLDDSVRKAALQPHNHVCLPEYTQARRNADLAALAPPRAESEAEAEAGAGDKEGGEGEPRDEEAERKKRRKEKKMRKAAERRANAIAHANASASPESASTSALAPAPAPASEPVQEEQDDGAEVEGLDTTLLAVVGILDAVRAESNVAGWIYAGGLWGPYAQEQTRGRDAPGAGNDADEADETPVDEGSAPLWFEHPETVRYWTARGRAALDQLGIRAAHGLSVQ